MSKPAEGGCLCGAVRYRATGESLARTLCHCRSCRLASGAPSLAWVVFQSSDFAFIAESPVSFHSSPGVTRTFCGKCGTPLTYQRDAERGTIDVTTVTLDAANDFGCAVCSNDPAHHLAAFRQGPVAKVRHVSSRW